MVNLFIVRHGETELNGKGIIQCQADTYSINNNGRNDARYLGELFSSFPDIDIIISSPLKRAVATASIIASFIHKSIVIIDDLQEMAGGNANSMTVSEFEAMQFNPPLIFKGAVSNNDFFVKDGKTIRSSLMLNDLEYQNFSYPNGESKASVKNRFQNSIINFVSKYPLYKNIIVVSHGFTIKSFIAGIPDLHDFKMMNHRDILHFSLSNNIFSFIDYKKFQL